MLAIESPQIQCQCSKTCYKDSYFSSSQEKLSWLFCVCLCDNVWGDAKGVVDAIDSYCWGGKLIMNVGDVKGALVDKEIINLGDKKDKVLVELGAHIGYSTVRFARLFQEKYFLQLQS